MLVRTYLCGKLEKERIEGGTGNGHQGYVRPIPSKFRG